MISKSDERLFRQAAVVGAVGQPHVRVGVVVSVGRRPYMWECNMSGPTFGEPFLEGHAEVRAIKKGIRPKSTMYVVRLDRAGNLMPSMPCVNCAAAIKADGNIKQVVCYDGHQIKKVRV